MTDTGVRVFEGCLWAMPLFNSSRTVDVTETLDRARAQAGVDQAGSHTSLGC